MITKFYAENCRKWLFYQNVEPTTNCYGLDLCAYELE